MARVAVAGAGAVVGGVVGFFAGGPAGAYTGAQLGFALGSVVAAVAIPPSGPSIEGPRLNDLSVQTSGYGVPIPVVVGRSKIAGNVIWKTGIREQRTTRRRGKGGGGARTTEYTYTCSFAVGLCEWLSPTAGASVLRIWLDSKLVYDATGASDVASIAGLVWRFYPGSETQLPDPLIEATVGTNLAPAHRGLAYIVFEDLPLDSFGRRIPNVTVEVASAAAQSFPQVEAIEPFVTLWPSEPSTRIYLDTFQGRNVAVDFGRGRIYEGRSRTTGAAGTVADEMIRVYDLATMVGIADYRYDQVIALVTGGSSSLQGNGCGVMHLGVDGFLYVAGGTSTRVPIFKINPDTMTAVAFFGASALGASVTTANTTDQYLNAPVMLTSFQVPRLDDAPRTFLAGTGANGGCYIIAADTMTYVWGHADAADPTPIPGQGATETGGQVVKIVPGAQAVTGSDVWALYAPFGTTITITRVRVTSTAEALTADVAIGVTSTEADVIDVVAEIDASATRVDLLGAWWDQTDDSLVITISGDLVSGERSRFTTFKWKAGTILWSVVNHAGSSTDDARGEADRVLSGLWGRGGNFVLQPSDGATIVNAFGDLWQQTIAWLDEQRAVLGWSTNRTLVKRYLTRTSAATPTVGVVVSALCERAGLSAAEVNVSNLTTSIPGYTVARPMSARDAIAPLLTFSIADAVEQDDILVFRRRSFATSGGPGLDDDEDEPPVAIVAATIPYEDLVREEPDALVIEERRAQDAELPAVVTVRYPDISRGYEQGAQTWQRPRDPIATMASRAVSAFDVPVPMTSVEAKTLARRICVGAWRERTVFSFSVGPKYARLVPTDVILVETRDGAFIRLRVLSTQLGANWTTRIEAITDAADVYNLTALAEDGFGWAEAAMPMPYYAQVLVPDLALIDDADDTGQVALREYAFVAPYGAAQFRGVTVIERGAGTPWEQIGLVTTPSEWGGLIETPPPPPTPWTWDDVGTLRVAMTAGQPESATDAEVLNGANMAALVAPDGSAEIVQWVNATQEADGSWTLSRLLRGRRGTEDLIASRAAGHSFVVLDAARLTYDSPVADADVPRQHKAVTIFQTQDSAPPGPTKLRRGRAEMPYAPAHVAGTRDGSQNLTITWVRRTRFGGELRSGTGMVPLNEGAEAYEVDVMNGGTVVRTITGLTSPSASYSAANQTADFGAPQASVTVRVYQISSIVGRGVPAEVAL